ncbi:MAG: alcohol dehydrogenase catalytic domain-containing protein [Candidatus Omnitrophica bacterium]|nr:alcohol dehydrogenase catalytic domain-containing protein [Candidatus Omnitrophota bacterium]
MKAAVYYSNSDIRIEERPAPKIGPGELLVKVEACGICGSDVMEWYRIGRVPLILGHEIAGVVQEAGPGVNTYKSGDRVSASHHVPCGKCVYCLAGHETVCDTLRKTNFDPGGFCQYLRLPKVNVDYGVYALPDSVTFDQATFIEPLACVLRGQRVAGFCRGLSVLVIGSGIAGLLHIKFAKAKGASPVFATDISDYRLKAAQECGADKVFSGFEYSADSLRKSNQGRLADLVILTTAAPQAISQALDSVERAGTVLFFAPTDKDVNVPFSVNDVFWRNERKLVSSYAASPKDHREALELIRAKAVSVEDMITHRLSLDETGLGFRLVSEAKNSMKVIIYPQRS